MARGLKFYQRSGLAAVARGTGILSLLGLSERERLLPKIDSEFFFSEFGKTYRAAAGSARVWPSSRGAWRR